MTSPRIAPLQIKKDGVVVDLAKQRGMYESADLRENVLKWQTSPRLASPVEVDDKINGKVAKDVIKKTPEKASEPKHTDKKVQDIPPKTPEKSEEIKNIRNEESGVQEDGTTKSSPIANAALDEETTIEQDLRAASAPKKRVVSDEHWKKGRSPSKNKPSLSPKPITPTKVVGQTIYMRPGSTKYDAWIRRRSAPAKELTVADKRATPSPGTSTRKPTQVTTPVKRVVDQNPEVQETAIVEAQTSSPSVSKRTTPSKDNKFEKDNSSNPREVIAMKEVLVKSASPKPRQILQEKYRIHSASPTHIHGKTDVVLRRPEIRVKAVVVDTKTKLPVAGMDEEKSSTQSSGNKVDAWLTSTPDPFLDDGDSDWSDAGQQSPIEIANKAYVMKPLSIKVRKSETRKDDVQHDRKDNLTGKREINFGTRRRSIRMDSDTRHNYEITSNDPNHSLPKDDYEHNYEQLSVDGSSEISTPTTPTLKRSKATRKITSPRRNVQVGFESVLESITSSSAMETTTLFTGSVLDSQSTRINDENTSPWYRNKTQNHGTRLSAIASVETLSTVMQDHAPDFQYSKKERELRAPRHSPPNSTMVEHSDADSKKPRPRMARKMTSHADLISVLSMADDEHGTLHPTQSVRSCRSKLGPTNLTEIMADLKSNELKYLRELRTMVDGVVPVLLNCVVSKSNSAVAAGLFSSLKSETNATTLIMNMGVALERLKSAHQRMPNSSPEALLTWAQGSHRIYVDYLQAWRMGFQDVVVNLAPADRVGSTAEKKLDLLPRSKEGYIVNDNGGKVDVAYLLKRPLVRLKYLARTLKNIESVAPSDQASLWSSKYQELVEEARRRQDEERARLEDQAASSIDSTRAREPQTLAPLTGVSINPSRCVRARDFFTLKLQHSSGQRIDCGVELLLRDNTPDVGEGGDVLICEVDSTSKWLLLPPVQFSHISARPGDQEDEIVAMVRGEDSNGLEWYELLSLKAGNPLISHEWIQLLGHKPVPPLFNTSNNVMGAQLGALVLAKSDTIRTTSRTVVDIPIGEKVDGKAKHWRSQYSMSPEVAKPMVPGTSIEYYEDDDIPTIVDPRTKSPAGSQVSYSWRQNFTSSPDPNRMLGSPHSPARSLIHPSRSPLPSPPPSPSQRMSSGNAHTDRGQSVDKNSTERQGISPTRSTVSRGSSYTVWYPQQDNTMDESDNERQDQYSRGATVNRLGMERRISSTPNDVALPHILRVRTASPSDTRSSSHNSPQTIKRKDVPNTPLTPRPYTDSSRTSVHQSPRTPLYSPPQTKSGSMGLSIHTTPVSSAHRRSSSPLKREYRPSSDSDSSSAMGDILSDDDESITSDSSADDMFSHTPMPAGLFKLRIPSGSVYSPTTPNTLTPSQSASQGPYRSVPPQMKPAVKMIASLFCWSDKGSWESIHPDECSVVVGPGIIEAFEITAAHSETRIGDQHNHNQKPLVALELTPLVPLRRGTALDISIRSPPTANSAFRAGNNIMFRSRTGQECELLYGHINQARINNPTYIALQNARGPFGGGTWASYMDHRANMRNHSAWWRFGSKKSSYRKSNTRPGGSSVAQTDSSVGTIASPSGNYTTSVGMSTLRRISGGAGSKVFNVGKSTVSSRGRISGSSTTFTSSSGSSSIPAAVFDSTRHVPAIPPAGLTNALRIRLYLRETPNKWRDIGAARLTIMQPPSTTTAMLMNNASKRILITGKTRGETLLDVVLGESSFERVARTGIAVNIWEERRGDDGEVVVVGKTGGVGSGRGKVFMIQLKSEAETAYAFSLVGRLRY